jgi:hypothetical protein
VLLLRTDFANILKFEGSKDTDMGIYLLSPQPRRLLASFDEAIGNHNIETWSIVQIQRKHFYTHVSANWGLRRIQLLFQSFNLIQSPFSAETFPL